MTAAAKFTCKHGVVSPVTVRELKTKDNDAPCCHANNTGSTLWYPIGHQAAVRLQCSNLLQVQSKHMLSQLPNIAGQLPHMLCHTPWGPHLSQHAATGQPALKVSEAKACVSQGSAAADVPAGTCQLAGAMSLPLAAWTCCTWPRALHTPCSSSSFQ